MPTMKCYSELIKRSSFEERFNYLSLNGVVGEETFGWDRHFNQRFYRSAEWKRLRDDMIVRDMGCDLGVRGREIYGQKILIHHMNPICLEDIVERNDILLHPEYLICVSHETHLALHYGSDAFLDSMQWNERSKYDTCPWKRNK